MTTRKKSGEAKAVRTWAPISPTGVIWDNWIQRNRRKVLAELNDRFAGWRDYGYTLERVEIRRIKK